MSEHVQNIEKTADKKLQKMSEKTRWKISLLVIAFKSLQVSPKVAIKSPKIGRFSDKQQGDAGHFAQSELHQYPTRQISARKPTKPLTKVFQKVLQGLEKNEVFFLKVLQGLEEKFLFSLDFNVNRGFICPVYTIKLVWLGKSLDLSCRIRPIFAR